MTENPEEYQKELISGGRAKLGFILALTGGSEESMRQSLREEFRDLDLGNNSVYQSVVGCV